MKQETDSSGDTATQPLSSAEAQELTQDLRGEKKRGSFTPLVFPVLIATFVLTAQRWWPVLALRMRGISVALMILGAGLLAVGITDSDSFGTGLGTMMLVGGFFAGIAGMQIDR